MLNTTTFVGLDVHARSIKAVALDAMTGEVRSATFGYDAAAVAEWADPSTLPRSASTSPASPGSTCRRSSRRWASTASSARSRRRSSHRPTARGRTTATTREFLARMLSVGNVVEVWVPDDECEAARDLVRALDDAREDLKRCKQRLSKFLLRHGPSSARRTPRAEEEELDRRALGLDKVDRVSREGRRRRARVLHRRHQAGHGGQEEAGEAGRGRGVEAPLEEEGRLAALLEGRRHHDGRRHRVRGRRVLQVQERQVVRRMARPPPPSTPAGRA